MSVAYKSDFKSYDEDRKMVYCCDCYEELLSNEDEHYVYDADNFEKLVIHDKTAKCDMCHFKFSVCSYCS